VFASSNVEQNVHETIPQFKNVVNVPTNVLFCDLGQESVFITFKPETMEPLCKIQQWMSIFIHASSAGTATAINYVLKTSSS